MTGSLDAIAQGLCEVGVRGLLCYEVSDRDGPNVAQAGLEENRRFFSSGGRGWVGIHAAFTCSDETLEAAAGLADDLGVGVHVHVCEGPADHGAPKRLARLTNGQWLLAGGDGDEGVYFEMFETPPGADIVPTQVLNGVAAGKQVLMKGADMYVLDSSSGLRVIRMNR